MPAFPKPNFVYDFDLNTELQNLIDHKSTRQVPEKSVDKLLIATWNIANLGLQDRWNEHYKLIAKIISWFDVIAIQETNDNLIGLNNIELNCLITTMSFFRIKVVIMSVLFSYLIMKK